MEIKLKNGHERKLVAAYIEEIKKFNAASRREAGAQLIAIDMVNTLGGVSFEKVWAEDGNHIAAVKHEGKTFPMSDYPDYENRLYQHDGVIFGVTLAKDEKVVGMKMYPTPAQGRKVIRLEIRRTLRSAEGWLDQPVPASDTNYFAKIMDDLETNAQMVAVRPLYRRELTMYYDQMTRETMWVLGMAVKPEPAAEETT